MAPAASILRLPREITQKFLFKAFEISMFDWVAASDTRFELCFVCTAWRDAIYAGAEFWSSIPVTRGHSTANINFILERARKRPLSIYILTCDFELAKRPYGFRLPTCLASVADFIAIKVPLIVALSEIMARAVGRPLYRTVTLFITVVHHSTTPDRRGSLDFLARKFARRISPIAVEGTAAVRSRCILVGVTILRQIDSTATVQWLDVPAENAVVNVPSLTDLHLTYSDATTIHVLEQLHLPTVRLVHLHLSSDSLDAFTHTFSPMLPQIHDFKLRATILNRTHLVEFLGAMTQLHDLDICRSGPDFFKSFLAAIEDDSNSIPALETLVIACDVDLDVEHVLSRAATHIFASGFVTIQKKHSRSKKVTVWQGANPSMKSSNSIIYEGASIAHQWAAKEKRPLRTL
ncbi:hypothetical protein C8R45DRAFT_936312 [Mycena sanguinolenta]|nr:hypothetical protein C8R45DRAFT_936312 [Mycena sanguinolenta]